MKAAELRTKNLSELQQEAVSLAKTHFGLRMQRATQQLVNHQQLGLTRKAIARTKTVIAEKRLASTGVKK